MTDRHERAGVLAGAWTQALRLIRESSLVPHSDMSAGVTSRHERRRQPVAP